MGEYYRRLLRGYLEFRLQLTCIPTVCKSQKSSGEVILTPHAQNLNQELCALGISGLYLGNIGGNKGYLEVILEAIFGLSWASIMG